jgi:hypothetical protein
MFERLRLPRIIISAQSPNPTMPAMIPTHFIHPRSWFAGPDIPGGATGPGFGTACAVMSTNAVIRSPMSAPILQRIHSSQLMASEPLQQMLVKDP